MYGEMKTTTVSAVTRQFLIIFAWFRIPALAQGILSSASVHTNSDPCVIQASHTQSRLAKEAYDESTSPSVSQCKTTPVVTASQTVLEMHAILQFARQQGYGQDVNLNTLRTMSHLNRRHRQEPIVRLEAVQANHMILHGFTLTQESCGMYDCNHFGHQNNV